MPTAVQQLPSKPPPASKPIGMAPDVENIDPIGDVVLALTRYFRLEDEEEGSHTAGDHCKSAAETPVGKPRGLSIESEKSRSGKEENDRKTDHQPLVSSVSVSSDCSSPTMDTSSEEVIIRASSRHLTLASPVFRAMLSRKFSESNALRTTGSVEIPLPDDDPDAFLILLNILHGQIRKVPQKVDLETFTQIAILVDKYDILEPVEMLANLWFENLKSTIPKRFTDDIPAWICICWVFGKPAEFLHSTRLAMRQGKDDLAVTGLPIPPSVSDAINSRRAHSLGRIIAMLHEYLNEYLEKEHCSFECDALMLGSLTKRLRTLQILPHYPDPPYAGLSFEDFNYRFRNGLYFPGAQRTSVFYFGHSKCTIRPIEKLLAGCDEQLCGLKLEEYRGSPQGSPQ